MTAVCGQPGVSDFCILSPLACIVRTVIHFLYENLPNECPDLVVILRTDNTIGLAIFFLIFLAMVDTPSCLYFYRRERNQAMSGPKDLQMLVIIKYIWVIYRAGSQGG